MLKRLTWFAGGMVAGAAGVGVAKRKVKEKAAELSPVNAARKATARVRDAVREGKRAAQAKEDELRARFDGRHQSLADELDPGDHVLVDGVPVEPGQVIVLRQVREQSAGWRGERQQVQRPRDDQRQRARPRRS
jgi:outer membrane murein-binding lipoprotein Lpp